LQAIPPEGRSLSIGVDIKRIIVLAVAAQTEQFGHHHLRAAPARAFDTASWTTLQARFQIVPSTVVALTP
jgi:hypothetical protein